LIIVKEIYKSDKFFFKLTIIKRIERVKRKNGAKSSGRYQKKIELQTKRVYMIHTRNY
jgi:hypothetical protein